MDEWTYYLPTKIVFGAGSFEKAGQYAKAFKAKKILVVTGSGSMKRLGYRQRLVRQLGGENVVLFEKVEPNPSCSTVDDGVRLARKEKCDLVVALGGGSAIDAAKVIAALAENKGKAIDYCYGRNELKKKGLHLIAIPTTSGTASEMNKYAVLTDRKRQLKKALRDFLLCPDIAIIDPELTVTTPREVTATTGLDVLCHAVESYWSEKANPASSMFALEAIRLVNENLGKACSNGSNLEARAGMSQASLFAGFAFSNTGTTDVHGLSYPLTTHFGLSHGFACAVFLPSFIEYNAGEIKEKTMNMAKALGVDSAKTMAARVRELMREVNAPRALGEFGVKEEDLDFIIKEGFGKKNNPRKISSRQLKELLKGIL